MLEGVGGVSHDDDVVSYQYSSGHTDVNIVKVNIGTGTAFRLVFLLDS